MDVSEIPVLTLGVSSFTEEDLWLCPPACLTAPFIWITWGKKKAVAHWGGGVSSFEGWMALSKPLPTEWPPIITHSLSPRWQGQWQM